MSLEYFGLVALCQMREWTMCLALRGLLNIWRAISTKSFCESGSSSVGVTSNDLYVFLRVFLELAVRSDLSWLSYVRPGACTERPAPEGITNLTGPWRDSISRRTGRPLPSKLFFGEHPEPTFEACRCPVAAQSRARACSLISGGDVVHPQVEMICGIPILPAEIPNALTCVLMKP